MIGNCYDIFEEKYTFIQYDGDTVVAIYFNPNGKGSFVENCFTVEFLLGINLEDIIDLNEYVFNYELREERIYDFGHINFASVLADIFDPDNHWIAFASGKEVSAFLLGIIEANRRNK